MVVAEIYSSEFFTDQYVIVDYAPVKGFGVFVEVGYTGVNKNDCLVEIPRKKARKMAKKILKATKRKVK